MLLRKLECQLNSGGANKIRKFFTNIRFRRLGSKLNFTIEPNTFGPGLCLAHAGIIVINGNSKIGKNARIHVGVNIGNYSRLDEKWVPDNVTVAGVPAKIIDHMGLEGLMIYGAD